MSAPAERGLTPPPAAETHAGPRQADLDRCVHCGLCLNSCPTYRVLGLEMDSPRGRIYQMAQVANGAPITSSYLAHMELCLACRGCETACPSGVQYGRLIEAARADIEQRHERGWAARIARNFVFGVLLPSPRALRLAGTFLLLYRVLGLQKLARRTGLLKRMGKLGKAEALAPEAQFPFFYRYYGKTLAPESERKYRVAFLGGCIANISFARLHEATVRVLRNNGCEVAIPANQTCCGALHVHAGVREEARDLARKNIAALEAGGYDAIITNSSGCGSALKEYGELLEDDPEWAARARRFSETVKDINEFLASVPLNPHMGELNVTATYQDSCHLCHGQKIRSAPRQLLRAIPGLKLNEMPLAEVCCGSAGTYNVTHPEIAEQLLERKMDSVAAARAGVIATANPGCMLQLAAGVRKRGTGQEVKHVVELLDEAYSRYASHHQR